MAEMIQVVAEATPNPNSLKFSWSKTICEGGPYDFADVAQTEHSPMAQKLFRQNGVVGVFIAKDFLTVTKHPGVGWDGLQPMVVAAITEHVQAGGVMIGEGAEEAPAAVDSADIESRIRAILDRDIRPALARDGGDAALVGYNAGVVMLELKGACAGCPSSTATLKMGIESHLREAIPEVTEVVAMM